VAVDGAEAAGEWRGFGKVAGGAVADALDVEVECFDREGGLEGVEDGQFGAVELEGGGGAEVEVGGDEGGNGVDRGAAVDDADVEGGAGVAGEGQAGDCDQGGAKGEDGIGEAGVGPGVTAGAGDGDAEAAAAEGAVDDGLVSGAFEGDCSFYLLGIG